jgi:hypothetical protein
VAIFDTDARKAADSVASIESTLSEMSLEAGSESVEAAKVKLVSVRGRLRQ